MPSVVVTAVTPTLRRLRHKNCKVEADGDYMVRLCLMKERMKGRGGGEERK